MTDKKTVDPTTPRQGWEADAVRAARANHMWLNAFQCVRPTDEFCAEVGRAVLQMLADRESTIESEYQLIGTERSLVMRFNKS